MTNNRQPIKVRKIPLPQGANLPVSVGGFDSMPQLYLDLLENKDKVKQDVVNKLYVPPAHPPRRVERKDFSAPLSKRLDQLLKVKSPVLPPLPVIRDVRESDSDSSQESDLTSRSEDIHSQRSILSDSASIDAESAEVETSPPIMRRITEPPRLEKFQRDEMFHSPRSTSQRDEYERPERPERDEYERPVLSPQQRFEKIYTKRPSVHPARGGLPPSLDDLNVRSAKVIPKFDNIDTGEADIQKRELLGRLDRTRKQYPELDIPEFSVHSDYKAIKRTFDSVHKNLQIDDNVMQYKMYMKVGFMMMETIMGKWMGLPMDGFSAAQVRNMVRYEKLLVEIGEKSYVDEASQLPVELRLLWVMITQACFFLGGNMFKLKFGGDFSSIAQNTQPTGGMGGMGASNMGSMGGSRMPSHIVPPKRKMKGPKFNINDLLDLSKE
ncbi:hypothetical protein OAV62_01580 [bacterium]|nr:hypothetical protein [bacterium]